MQVKSTGALEEFNFSIRITSGPHTTAFHKKKLFHDIQKKKVDFKKVIEEKKPVEKPTEKKSILNIKIENQKSLEKREEKEESKKSMGALGVVILSKKKTKDWLNVPVRAKQKTPLFPEKEAEIEQQVMVVETEEEEIPEDPVVIRGAKVNLLGKF